jgi:hypothetical protein
MGDSGQNPWAGRYQTRHSFLHNSAVNLKGSVADVVEWVCPHEKAELLEFGMSYVAAGGAMTTAGVLNLDIRPKNGGTRVIANSLAVLAFDNTKLVDGIQHVSLNDGGSSGPANYPQLTRGDVVIIEHVTQGAGGGAQSVKPFFLFRERP